MKKEMMMLGNLTCPSCAANVEQAFKKMDGVKGATVTFATGSLDIEYDETVVKAEQIERTIESFGLTIASRL